MDPYVGLRPAYYRMPYRYLLKRSLEGEGGGIDYIIIHINVHLHSMRRD